MKLVGQPFPGPDNHNTSPMSKAWVIRENPDESPNEQTANLEPLLAQWWLVPRWVKEPSTKYSMFNARSENLSKSVAFRTPYRYQRCVVPITGFYEWVNRNSIKQPYYIRDAEHQGLLLAGLWEHWQSPDGAESLFSFTIVTTSVVSSLKFLHHRQPVMLSSEEAKIWVAKGTSRKDLDELCASQLRVPLDVVPVSEYVNNNRNHGEQCLEEIGDHIAIATTG